MAEYLAPGVYVEETSFRSKSIEGVGTSTTGFAGATRKGPVGETPELITSVADFERIYGGLGELRFAGASAAQPNYLAHAVRAFFDNGGARLYVSRVFAAEQNKTAADYSAKVQLSGDATNGVLLVARAPGSGGNATAVFQQTATPATWAGFDAAPEGSIARVLKVDGNNRSWELYAKLNDGGTIKWKGTADLVKPGNAKPGDAPGGEAYLLGVSLTVADADGNASGYEDLSYSPRHPRWIGGVLKAAPSSRAEALVNLVALQLKGTGVTDLAFAKALFSAQPAINAQRIYDEPRRSFTLSGGADGAAPAASDFDSALNLLDGIEDISIIAAPGNSALADYEGIQNALIAHAEKRRAYRIAVLDTPVNKTVSEARDIRGKIDSTRAALYYPWVVVSNPAWRAGSSEPREIKLPPSGFVAGIYARNDNQRGVWKAPANEVVLGALRFETDINFAQQEVLNPLGVNCLRYLSGRGYRIWGARTVTSDPEWKYVNIRRYFNYLEASIDRGTQWAVFEPNGERLWANVTETISAFLYNEWKSGALLGTKPEQAFFVRCDRTTMTQNDLDNGRLICLVGVAALKPAEFVIFRIGQKTADDRS